jgi:hypothetical protein
VAKLYKKEKISSKRLITIFFGLIFIEDCLSVVVTLSMVNFVEGSVSARVALFSLMLFLIIWCHPSFGSG